jgi:membrane protease YdiL (CAAX protease family)
MEAQSPGFGSQMSEKARNSPALALLFLLWAFFTGTLLGNLLLVGLAQASGWGMEVLQVIDPEGLDRGQRDFLRIGTLLVHLCSFTLPAIAFAYWLNGRRWKEDLALTRVPEWKAVLAGIGFITLSFPLSQYLYWWNLQIPLPEQLLEMERSAEGMVRAIIQMDDVGELLLSLLTVGLVAALGEELIFRGLLQPRLCKLFGNEVLGIWVGAIVFSAIHLQFAGFLPRMILGVALGYLFHWTRNLWVPVMAHFFFNGAQIVVQYFFKAQMDQLDPETMQRPHWALAVLPLAGMALIAQFFKTRTHSNHGI